MSLVTVGNLTRTLAIVSYLASLALPPYMTRDPQMEDIGFAILILGWVSIFDHHLSAWFANPIVIFCFFRLKTKPYLCTALSALALLAAHDFAKVESLGWDSSGEIYMGEVVGLKIGCYLWLSSLTLTFLASIVHLYSSRRLGVKNV